MNSVTPVTQLLSPADHMSQHDAVVGQQVVYLGAVLPIIGEARMLADAIWSNSPVTSW
jgi:hypothetical protein